MSLLTDGSALFPTEYGALIDNATKEQAVAAKVLTHVTARHNTMSFPVLDSDPSPEWTAEGTEITLSDAGTSELIVTPKKVAGLTKISNEALADGSPDVAHMVGSGLARQIVEKVDAGLFAATTPANAAPGLPTFAVTELTVSGGLIAATNEDAFTEAKFIALDNGARLSAFVLATDVAKALAKVKVANGDARTLLSSDSDGNLRVGGLPAYVSRHVAPGEAWGIDRTQNYLVIRQGTEVLADRSSAFTSDSTLVRAVQRVAYGVTNAPGVIHFIAGAA